MIYFGTESHMQWIAAPAINVDRGRGRWQAGGTFLNGGAFEKHSVYGHRQYNMSWNLLPVQEAQQITDYADGVFGSGLLYLLDPFAADKNALPLSWSVPALACDDAPPMIRGKRPERGVNGANEKRLPANSAFYKLGAGDSFDSIFIPVPPGYHFHFGVVGYATGTARVELAPASGTVVTPELLPTTGTQLTNTVMSGTNGGVRVRLAGTGTIVLGAMLARVLPTNVGDIRGEFVSGQGSGGLRFSNPPTVTGYSAVMDLQAVSATLREVGPWE